MIRHNRAFWKAFNSLTHPITILSVMLLLLNDHVFRIYAPSWWTGKLGDFTWLTFAPFICAIFFAWILPYRHVAKASFGFIGLWFALAKIVPAIQHATNTALSTLIGWQTSLRIDPTDLLTLPALLIGWWVWQRAPETPPNLRPYGWFVVGMGIFTTLATSYDAVDHGINCVYSMENQIFAVSESDFSHFAGFESLDGGMSWRPMEDNYPRQRGIGCDTYVPERWELETDSLTFLFIRGQSIAVSADDGETWREELDLTILKDEQRRLYLERYDERFSGLYSIGPLDALYDEASGTLFVAMGHEGLLRRDRTGDWQWIGLGNYFYRQEIFPDIRSRLSILSDELILGFVLGFLTLTVITSHYLYISEGCNVIFVWGFWLFSHFLTAVFDVFWGFGDFYVFLLMIVMAYCLFDLWRGFKLYYWGSRVTLGIFGIAVICGVIVFALYMLPFLLWLQGTVGTYAFAWGFSLVLGNLGALMVGSIFQSRYGEYFNKHPRKRIDPKTSLEDLFYPE